MALDQSAPNLEGGWGLTNASSAIVTGGSWEVCTEYNFTGRCQILPPGQYNNLRAQLSDRIVSARAVERNRAVIVPPPLPPIQTTVGPFTLTVPQLQEPVASVPMPPPVRPTTWNGDRLWIEVYTDTDFRGEAYTLVDDIANLRNSGFNDRIRSMRIYGGNWEACEARDYVGICIVYGPGDYRRRPPQLDQSISSLRNWK